MMDGLCLVNFNARIYDPSLGRFMSADPIVGSPYDLQQLNRYSYVLDNPLSLTDPSGLCFLGCFWKQSWFGPLLDIALFFIGLPELEAGFNLGIEAAFSSVSAAGLIINAGIAGGISGYVSTGTFKGALISAGSAAAFAGLVPGLGSAINGGLGLAADATAGQFLASGLIGGLTSVAGGGNFGSGFLAGGVGSLAGPLTGGGPFDPGKAVLSAALGGVASVLGGGKFANGALTAAFAYAAATCTEGGCEGQSGVNSTSQDVYGKYGPMQRGTFPCGDVQCQYAYSTYQTPDGLRGVRLSVYYPGDEGDEAWLQTYTATGPGETGQATVDCDYGPCPFYSKPGTQRFFDAPGRVYESGTWTAQTSLVIPGQEGYSPVVTFTWGFRLSPSSIIPLPLHVVPPSNFQLQAIGSGQ